MRQVASPAVNPTPVAATDLPPSPSISTPVISSTSTAQPTAGSSGPQKYVVAHHMVGNTYPYTLKDWADDIALAHHSGIDGFALNMGKEVWEPARVSDAYVAVYTLHDQLS
jgi:glucan endo-1,3-alpha-glucosidase